MPGKSRSKWGFGLMALGLAGLVLLALHLRARPPGPVKPLLPGISVIRPPHDVMALAVQGDRVWAGGRDGLAAVDRKTGRLLPLPANTPPMRYVRDVRLDGRGGLWVGHRDGLSRYAQGQWRTFTPADGLLTGPVTALWAARDGALWVGGEGGVSRYDGQAFKTLTPSDGPGVTPVDVIYQTRDGAMWFGSASPVRGGLCRFDGGTWQTFTSKNGLPHNSVNDLLEDRQGTLWVATGFGDRGGRPA